MNQEVKELIFDDDINLNKTKTKKKSKKTKNKSKLKISLVIVFAILDVVAFLGYFLCYGPIPYFRNLIITTSMTTMTHKYVARTFYSDKMINKVLNNNYVKESNNSTDTSQIDFIQNDSGIYENKYEEQVLKHDKDEEYKLIPISGNGYVGNLVVIYDPSKIELKLSKYFGTMGQTITEITQENNALIGINASGFDDPNWMGNGSSPTGTVIQDGKIVYQGGPTNYGGGIIGFTKDNVLVLSKKTPYEAIEDGVEDAVDFGPFLIVNGEVSFMKGNGGWGIAPRTAIAQRKDGIVLFLIIDGRQPGYSIGIDMVEMTKILMNYGAYNAANLDGGASSVLSVEGKLYNKPCAESYTGERYSPNAWIVMRD